MFQLIAYIVFGTAIGLFFGYCLFTTGQKADRFIEKTDRDRIVANRDGKTLVKIPGTQQTYHTSNKNKEE